MKQYLCIQSSKELLLICASWEIDAETSIFFSLEDTTPGKPKFGDIERFQNAILVRWLPPDNAGLVCVTGYRLWWGENMPFHFSAEPLSGHKNHYLINNLSEYKIIFFFHCASIWNLTDPAKKNCF